MTEQTSLIGTESVNIQVGNHTHVDGALIAHINDQGEDGGHLSLDTRTLSFSDLQDHDQEDSNYLSIGFSTGGSSGANANTGANPDSEGSSWTVAGTHYELDREQTNRATIGQGNIRVREDANTGNDSTDGLNRDIDMAQEITKDKERDIDVYASSTATESVENLAASGDQNTLNQWQDNVASAVDPDSYQQVINNIKELSDQEAINEAWAQLVVDAKDTFGIEEKYLSATEYEQENPMAAGGLQNTQGAPGRQPTKEELVLLEGIRELKAQIADSDNKTMYGAIDWEQVIEHAWDLDNGGPKAALESLNEQIAAKELNDLGNIQLLRKQVYRLNALSQDFDATVGVAENIATMGSAVHRVGMVLAEAASESKAVRGAKDLIAEARRWTGDGKKGSTTSGARGDDKLSESKSATVRDADTRTATDGEMIGQPEIGLRFPTFETHGIKVDPQKFDIGRRMINEYKKMGYTSQEALDQTQSAFRSGSTLPESVTVNEPLYKMVIGGTKPNQMTEYFVTKNEYERLLSNPKAIADELALPQWSEAFIKYDIYEIKPKDDAVVFQSQVAPATQGSVRRSGGAIQTLVPNRNQFEDPRFIDSASIKND